MKLKQLDFSEELSHEALVQEIQKNKELESETRLLAKDFGGVDCVPLVRATQHPAIQTQSAQLQSFPAKIQKQNIKRIEHKKSIDRTKHLALLVEAYHSPLALYICAQTGIHSSPLVLLSPSG